MQEGCAEGDLGFGMLIRFMKRGFLVGGVLGPRACIYKVGAFRLALRLAGRWGGSASLGEAFLDRGLLHDLGDDIGKLVEKWPGFRV